MEKIIPACASFSSLQFCSHRLSPCFDGFACALLSAERRKNHKDWDERNMVDRDMFPELCVFRGVLCCPKNFDFPDFLLPCSSVKLLCKKLWEHQSSQTTSELSRTCSRSRFLQILSLFPTKLPDHPDLLICLSSSNLFWWAAIFQSSAHVCLNFLGEFAKQEMKFNGCPFIAFWETTGDRGVRFDVQKMIETFDHFLSPCVWVLFMFQASTSAIETDFKFFTLCRGSQSTNFLSRSSYSYSLWVWVEIWILKRRKCLCWIPFHVVDFLYTSCYLNNLTSNQVILLFILERSSGTKLSPPRRNCCQGYAKLFENYYINWNWYKKW